MAQSTSEQRAAEFMTALRSRVAAQDLLQDAQVAEIIEGKTVRHRGSTKESRTVNAESKEDKSAGRGKAGKSPRAPRKSKKASGK